MKRRLRYFEDSVGGKVEYIRKGEDSVEGYGYLESYSCLNVKIWYTGQDTVERGGDCRRMRILYKLEDI
jgi:hypothetical protein